MGLGIRPDELKELLKSTSLLLVDVRRRIDYDADPETIPGASWRDPERIEDWVHELPREMRVVVYCVKGGAVSQATAAALVKKDIDARYLEGGLKAWKE